MAKIRDDLEGVVWVDVDGTPVKLVAGDTVPDGVAVGVHVLADVDTADEHAVEVPEGDPNESWKVDELKAYAAEHTIDLGDATKKADILAAIELAGEN
ncbi:hypothetical protein [Gordonia sp. ABSL49_1]|uniref:hypothetical protein n=1 Tax=Gordonia sp. ABSL49_1 TaxID=2920941 RepID=UPI001F0FA96C|nr:hypothetical protein [Gordonia sp. ABSL49_1]MCH5645158.1 hypothetical protein [Gordonia sp. ABSL49_1]